jgi:hypothetical protein
LHLAKIRVLDAIKKASGKLNIIKRTFKKSEQNKSGHLLKGALKIE